MPKASRSLSPRSNYHYHMIGNGFGCLIVAGFFFFLTTSLLLYHILERLDDANVILLSSNYQRRKRLQKQLRHGSFEKETLTIRQVFEQDHDPNDWDRIRQAVDDLRRPSPKPFNFDGYDIYNCPPTPPSNYPVDFNVLDVLENWNPDETNMPSSIYQSLCVFQYPQDMEKAKTYRDAEVPFLLQNHPEILKTSERWSPEYLSRLIGNEPVRNEHSTNNHFMFWKLKPGQQRHGANDLEDWKPPTENVQLNFDEWYDKAQSLQQQVLDDHDDPTQQDRWYFRLNGAYQGPHGYLYDELPIFDPTKPSFFMVEPQEQRGINCRFGMKGVIAECHYDLSRNFIVLLGGARRYVLAAPHQCPNLELFPQGHPSGRHSSVNWSDPPLTGKFAQARVNEVVLQAGDALYLPTYWFHFIVSLNINYQCNARSGMTLEHQSVMQQCGFS